MPRDRQFHLSLDDLELLDHKVTLEGGASRYLEGAKFGLRSSIYRSVVVPGGGPVTHSHPYPEVIAIDTGTGRFQVGSSAIEAIDGDVVIVPAGAPHAFVNSGSVPLLSTGFHDGAERAIVDVGREAPDDTAPAILIPGPHARGPRLGVTEVGGVITYVEGAEHGIGSSVFRTQVPPGVGPRPHYHPFDEVFFVDEGAGQYYLGDRVVEATQGDVVIVRAGTVHAFVNVGSGPLRITTLLDTARFVELFPKN